MDSTLAPVKSKRGKSLTNAQRLVVISKLIEVLQQGYYTTNQLSKMTGLTRKMIDTYRPLADEVITNQVLNRNNIRNLQIQRTYKIIEMLMQDLQSLKDIKHRTLIYNQIAKFSQHLALITGLNVETHVNVDAQQLVIVRADNGKKPIMLNEVQTDPKEPELITIKDSELSKVSV